MIQSAVNDFSSLGILCVDDDAVMRSVVQSALHRRGCDNVVQANGGQDALDLCAGRTFDLIICDFLMRPMTGLDFLRALAEAGMGKGWPVIMLSANTDPATIQEAQDLGVSAWVGKPVSVHILIDRVATVLRARGLLTGAKPDAELLATEERHHAVLMIALSTAEEAVRGIALRAREAAGLAHGLRQVLDGITQHAGTLGYGLVTMLSGRAEDLVAAMERNPASAIRGHADAARALGTLVTAMKRVTQNRMQGDGAEAGLKLLGKIDGILDPVRARIGG
jgi:CheY-like chemotaxis protein